MFWWLIATLCAFFVKGLCGFANTLVFTTILSFGNSNINISPVELLLGYPTNLILAWKERKAIRWSMCLPLAALVILGSIPGILFLKSADTRVIKVLFGFVIVLLGLEMFLRERNRKADKGWNRKKDAQIGEGQASLQTGDCERKNGCRSGRRKWEPALAVIGILSGILCGLYGVGALLGAYVSRVSEDSHAFKGNICVVFLAENTMRMIFYLCWGIITFDIFRQALVLMPMMLLGLWLGIMSGRILNEKLAKKVVIIMLIVSGVALIINSLA